MEQEIAALLARARALLGERCGDRGPITLSLDSAELLHVSRPVFYELGIAASEEGPIARAQLRLAAKDASPRALRIAIFASKGNLVVATRWIPHDRRPLLVTGPARASAWTDASFERALAERIDSGVVAFEEDLARGEGHLDSSGDLLALGD